jgi:hypothetical protein
MELKNIGNIQRFWGPGPQQNACSPQLDQTGNRAETGSDLKFLGRSIISSDLIVPEMFRSPVILGGDASAGSVLPEE